VTGIRLLPSRHDSLDPVARMLRWWVDGLRVLPRRPVSVSPEEVEQASSGSRVVIGLTGADVFVCERVLPPGRASVHAKALDYALDEVSPLNRELVEVSAMAAETGPSTRYRVAIARRDRLESIEARARRRKVVIEGFHPATAPELRLSTPRMRRRDSREKLAWVVCAATLIAASMVSIQAHAMALQKGNLAALGKAQSTRAAALELERARRETALADSLLRRGLLERRPGAVLEDMAAITRALPNSAHLASVTWRPESMALSGTSRDGLGSLQEFAAAAPEWRVDVTGAVRSEAGRDGRRFELQASRRDGGE
jgi:hypothetical protein